MTLSCSGYKWVYCLIICFESFGILKLLTSLAMHLEWLKWNLNAEFYCSVHNLNIKIVALNLVCIYIFLFTVITSCLFTQSIFCSWKIKIEKLQKKTEKFPFVNNFMIKKIRGWFLKIIYVVIHCYLLYFVHFWKFQLDLLKNINSHKPNT